jgi:glycosyltransferase involved in cell wall biosynthesis
LNLYGEGDGESSLQKTVSEKKINIIIHRPTSQIHNRYIESSFLLMTSIFEPFGLVLPEAMSCGLPVVAFDCPYGPAEIITDGKDGFLIKKRDINEFALRVSQLIEDCNLRVKMGKEAIKTAQRFHKDLIMPKWKSLFEEISKVSK